jgi:hypothetical protein
MLVQKNTQRQTPADRCAAIMAALLDPLVDSIDTAADRSAAPPLTHRLPGRLVELELRRVSEEVMLA